MSRSLMPIATILSVCMIVACAACPVNATPGAAAFERVQQIKRIQQQQLMGEALEWRSPRFWWQALCEPEGAECVGQDELQFPAIGAGNSQRPSPRHNDDNGASVSVTATSPPNQHSRPGTFDSNIPVNDPALDDPARADGQSEPSIAAWGNYVLAGWNDGRGSIPMPGATLTNTLNYGYSIDGGQSFTTAPATGPTALPILPLGGTWTADPVIAVNEKTGDFYFCGLFDPPNGNGFDEHGVAVARATFNTTTNAISWTTPVVVRSLLETAGFIDKPWIAVDSLSGNVYVTYTRFTTTADSIAVTRSTNKGLTWGPQITLSSPAAAGFVQGSRTAVGPDGELYVTWKEIGLTGTGEDFMRVRRSNDFGISWGPLQTAAAFFDNFGTGAPGYNREQGIALPSIAVDRSSGPFRGRVYVAWNESVNFYDSIPDTTTEPVINEAEPDDSTNTAQPFTPGTAIRGAFNTLNDLDYYRFSAEQGTSYIFWANELSTRYTIRIFGTDGVTRLAFSGDRFHTPPNPGFIVWTCPASGAYYMRMAIVGTTLSDYRVDTGVDTPGGFHQRARDHRDTFVASSPNGSAWSTPVMLSVPEPALYDDWLPEVAVSGQGAVFALWYDFSRSRSNVSGGESQCSMARSDDGGASWMALGRVADVATYWTDVRSNIIPNQGDYIALFANHASVIPAWTDGRLGTPDIRAAILGADVVVPTLAAIASAQLVEGHAVLAWDLAGMRGEISVERSIGGGPWETLATLSADGSLLRYLDATVAPGEQYRYRLALEGSQGTLYTSEVELNIPGLERMVLENALPNPARGEFSIAFTLADQTPAVLELLDLAGRLVVVRRLGSPEPGRHLERIGGLQALSPGIYFARLLQGEHTLVGRVAVVR